MKKDRQRKAGFVKPLMTTVCIIGMATLSFQGLTQVVMAMETQKTETIFTRYSTGSKTTNTAPENALPDGYVKPDYQLADNDLEYYRDKKPTSADLSREAAAELGVQGLYRVFGLDMNGKTIEMAYNPAQNGHRATWEGNWWPDGKKAAPRHMCRPIISAWMP